LNSTMGAKGASEKLFFSQRKDRVDATCPARWNECSHDSNGDEKQRAACQSPRLYGTDTVDHACR
jgi:hypothetical protein